MTQLPHPFVWHTMQHKPLREDRYALNSIQVADMKFIAEYYKPDLVLMPIGGNFTLGPQEAAYAAKELLKIPEVIPMHYGANPLAKGTLAQFVGFMGKSQIKVHPAKPGDVIQFQAGKNK